MPNYAKLAKGLSSLAKGTQDVLPAAEREANLAKFLEGSVAPKLYHGTVVRPDTETVKSMGDIKEFDRLFSTKFRRPSVDTMGNWFSDNPGKGGAEMYSGAHEGSAIYPVHVSMKNPHETTFELMQRRARLLANGKDDGRPIGQAEVDAYRKWLKDIEKDGVIVRRDSGAPSGSTEFDNQSAYITLEPNQIKSAIGNKGTYDVTKPDINEAKGGAIRMQVGGLTALANVGRTGAKLTKAEMAALRARGMGVPGQDFADTLNPKDVMRMSEALGNAGAEGKTLNLTQADRSRVFGPNKGGTGFSGLQLTSEPHQQAGSVWGVGKPSHVTRLINANTPETIWSTFIGAPTQHMSNPVTVERMYEAHRKAKPSAELIEKMNKQINSAVNPKTGKPVFSEAIDISDPTSLSKAQTFDQRKVLAQAMTMGGEKKGEKAAQEAFRIIKEETDPLLTDAPTYAVGNRLFTIDKDTGIYRPDLNAAFPHQVTGTDLGLLFEPAPIELAARDFVAKYADRTNKAGKPQPMGHKDLTATTPRQFISEDYLTNLQKEGYKDGGSTMPSFTERLQSALETHMAMGGEVSDNTTPDMTDGGNVIYGGQYAKGGNVHMPIRSLKQVKPRRYAEAGYVDPLGAPDYEVSKPDRNMVELAGRMIKEQAAKEGAVLSTPEGRRDIALKVASHMPGLGMGGDLVSLVDWVQSLIPAMSKPASVLDTEGKGDRVAKYPLRSVLSAPTGEEFQEKFKEMGIQGESEAPVTEFVGSLFAPGAAMKAPRKIEGGLNAVTAAARRPFTPATVTTEAVAPDLAKFKPRAFQDYATKQMIGEGAAVPMTTMGGRKTTQRHGQGVYLNEAGQLELNPMVGVDVPRAGNLSTNRALRGDIATAGQELNQEAMAAHRFVPMATNNIKDASSMMITGPNGRALTNAEVIELGKRLPGMIVTHSPRTGGVFVAPFSMEKGKIPTEFLDAQSAASAVLGKNAKIQFGKSDPNKDLMYMMRQDYGTEGGRGTSEGAQAVRKSLKRMDQSIPSAR